MLSVKNISSRTVLAGIAFVLIGMSLVVFWQYLAQHAISGFDDAYMFIRYANNFRMGHGVAWNPDGVQTYGVTSLLHFAAVTLAKVAVPSLREGTLLSAISALFTLLAILMLALTCARFAKSHPLRQNVVVWLGLFFSLFLFSPTLRAHAVTGMDTTLSLFCNSLLIYATVQWMSQKRALFQGLTLMAAYLTFVCRPENLIYAAVFPVICLGMLAKQSRRKAAVLSFLGMLIGILLGDTLWKYLVFGDPLPLAFYVKRQGFYEGYIGVYQWNPIPYLFEFGRLAWPFLIMTAVCLKREWQKMLATFWLPVLLTVGYFFSIVQIMGYHARYYVPSIPFLAVSAGLLLDRCLVRGCRAALHEHRAVMVLRLTTVTGLTLFLFTRQPQEQLTRIYQQIAIPAPTMYRTSVSYATPNRTPLPALGWPANGQAIAAMLRRFPTGTRVSLSEYGLVGASAPQVHIIDPLGLHDVFFAHHGFSVAEFFDRQPEWIWLPHPHYTRIVASILGAKAFWQNYEFYPNMLDYGVAIRKDSAHAPLMRDALSDACQAYYGIRAINQFLATPQFPK